jgi:argininosuccinate lyase
MRMWGGRFGNEPGSRFLELTSSVSFDVRLYPYDIACTAAWAGAIADAGVISAVELKEILGALEEVRGELDSGEFRLEASDEDIHTAVERRLVDLIGPAGGYVRTGRSRNDQVATDTRMLVMDESGQTAEGVRALQKALLGKAEETKGIIVPGHTHLQQAQPVPLAQLLLAFVQMLERDHTRILWAADSADMLPLGSAALAGTGITIDRDQLARELGFSRISANSIDAVSDRDFVTDTIYALSALMVHLSRLGEQVVLWCSEEFGLAYLDDAWATGSSIMPQKKNPDGPELVRARSGRVIGDLVAVLAVMKGLPLSYNRDLQEDKEPLFDALDTAGGCLHLMERTVDTMTFDTERAVVMAGGGFLYATDLADYLVEKGMPFPDAHEMVGRVVTYCLEDQKTLTDLNLSDLNRFSGTFEEDVFGWMSPDNCLARRGCRGGTSIAETERQLRDARTMIQGTPTGL